MIFKQSTTKKVNISAYKTLIFYHTCLFLSSIYLILLLNVQDIDYHPCMDETWGCRIQKRCNKENNKKVLKCNKDLIRLVSHI